MANLNNNVFTLNKYVEFVLDGLVGQAGWNAAWFGGGNPAGFAAPSGRISTVDRIIFLVDTATAVNRGPLSLARFYHAASGNTTDAWFGGGYGASAAVAISTVDRIIFAADTAAAVAKGPLSLGRWGLAASGNTTDAWFGAGATQPAILSTVDRIIFSSDTATAVAKGPLSATRRGPTAHGNTTDAWFGGGQVFPAGTYVTSIDRVIFSSDTATAVAKGPLTAARYTLAASGNTTDAWFGGGFPTVSTVDRIIFASDTATAVAKGPLSLARYSAAASGSAAAAWFGGGYGAVGFVSTVDRIIFSADTATAAAKGPLSSVRGYLASN